MRLRYMGCPQEIYLHSQTFRFSAGGYVGTKQDAISELPVREDSVYDMPGRVVFRSTRSVAVGELLAERVGDAAVQALRAEVWAAPKPGLVDRYDSGAHSDMNITTFLASASVLESFFSGMFLCGYLVGIGGYATQKSPKEAFWNARIIGVEAEKAMLQATGGVNTHKGAIFSLGLLATAAGYVAAQWNTQFVPCAHAKRNHAILNCAGEMVDGIVERELKKQKYTHHSSDKNMTAGERLHTLYGITGIRGEAERGFPSLRFVGIPVFIWEQRAGTNQNDLYVQTLLSLMTLVEDTNVVSRGGISALRYVRAKAMEILLKGGVHTKKGRCAVQKMNRECIEKNISPGGSADMLSSVLFLHSLYELIGKPA